MNSRTEFGQPIFFIDPDFNIKKCSKSLKSILDFADESELVGQPCHQLFFNLAQPCRMCPVPRALVLKNSIEQKIQDDSGSGSRSRFVMATPIQDSTGAVQYVIMDCLGDNFSLPQKMQHAPSSRNTHKVKSFPAYQSVLLDRDMTVILYNKGMQTFISDENMDIIGRNIFTIAPYYNRPEIRNRLEDFIYRDEQLMITFETLDHKFGGGRTQHLVEKLDGHGHVEAFVVRSTAVEENTSEEKWHFREQLKMQSQFASRMAHDVKNALALISTNADFIASEFSNSSEEHRNIAQYADIIQKHVKQIVGIVEHANSLKVHNWDTTAESDLSQLINRVVTITQLSKPYISHDIRLKIAEPMPRIITSELYLERALTELVKAILLNSEENSTLNINLKFDQTQDMFLLSFICHQHVDLFSNLEQKLKQFFIAKTQWEPAMLGILIAYAAVLIQGGSLRSTLLENGEFHILLKLPRAPQLH